MKCQTSYQFNKKSIWVWGEILTPPKVAKGLACMQVNVRALKSSLIGSKIKQSSFRLLLI